MRTVKMFCLVNLCIPKVLKFVKLQLLLELIIIFSINNFYLWFLTDASKMLKIFKNCKFPESYIFSDVDEYIFALHILFGVDSKY